MTAKYYDIIIEQLSKKAYNGITAYVSLLKTLKTKRDLFISKDIYLQIKLLTNVVSHLRRGGSAGVDLSVLGEATSACRLRVGYDITNVDFVILHQSPCGLNVKSVKV